jgi:hypothetical protein
LRAALKGLLEPRSKDDERTAWQRWADALGELARRRLDAGDLPERGGEKPHLMLVAQLSTLRLEPGSPLAELNWGPQVSGETARRIGCDAVVTPVIVDENGEVLHVGRSSRSIRTHLRRAANIRDRHCQGPGCTVPAEECQIHYAERRIMPTQGAAKAGSPRDGRHNRRPSRKARRVSGAR